MPKKDFILNLLGFTLKKVHGYDPLVLEVGCRRKHNALFVSINDYAKKEALFDKCVMKPSDYDKPSCGLKRISFIAITANAISINDFPAYFLINERVKNYAKKFFIIIRTGFLKKR